MALTPGTRFGAYDILTVIGAGGMGEVYRARDTKLGREVAIKILPEPFSHDAERIARFEREARTLASLNHPNIASIYGLEKTQDIHALVMELVEGRDLSQRIARGPIAVDESLSIAMQIAHAIEAAHEQGIIHRDLKPGNIKLTEEGTVKLLDFGLAKLTESAGSGQPAATAASISPTITSPAMMTGIGVLLGTAAYMSPEQAKGRPADKRSDIWAFGCVMYEMLTGRRAFEGDGVSDTVAAVLRAEPDWTALPEHASGQLRRLLRRCLAKDVRERLRDIGDVELELKELLAAHSDVQTSAGVSPRSRRRRALTRAAAVSLAVVALAGAIFAWRTISTVSPADAIKFSIQPPAGTTFTGMPGGGTGVAPQFALSPDGRNIVFVAASKGAFTLWVRPLGSLEARELPGTDQATFPFWSPDSRFIGFFAAGKLKKVSLAGGPPLVLCDSAGGRGGTWNRDDIIVFAPGASALQRVSAAGGVPTPVAALDSSREETSHRWPHFLPDGRHFFYTGVVGPLGTASRPSEVKIGSLDSKDVTPLFAAESAVSYSSGHLFFWREGTLMAQPFDADARRITGDPFPVAQQVIAEGLRYVAAAVSPTGVLVYATRSTQGVTQLTWRNRAGRILGTVGEAASYTNLALAPDGQRLAVSLPAGRVTSLLPGGATDIWVINLERSTSTRITFASGNNAYPTWSPNGDRIAFFSSRMSGAIYEVAVDGGGHDEVLLRASGAPTPTDWSRDGRYITFTQASGAATGTDVMILPLAGDRKPRPFVSAPFEQDQGVFSPDGRWMAYMSGDAVAGTQIFVQPFPPTGGQYQISRNGGTQPIWGGDGKELFFLTPDGQMVAVAVDTRNRFEYGNPEALFQTGLVPGTGGNRQYAVTGDGQRFLINLPVGSANETTLTVATNWRTATAQ